MPELVRVRWSAAVGFVLVAMVSGCGSAVTDGQASGESSPAASSASTSTSAPAPDPVDAEAAYAKVEQARQPMSCTPLLAGTLQAAMGADVQGMRKNAQQFRDLVTAWDGRLAGIQFPADATPIVARLKEFTAAEVKDLTAMIAAPDNVTPQDATALANSLNVDETSIRVELDKLSGSLGHPEPQAFVAGNQLELAYGTFRNSITPVWPQFEDALKRNDLAAAKAANAIEQEAAQRYIDAIDAITWPPGYEEKVTTLQDALRGVIEFDRKQVDVPTAADIRTSGPAGESPGITSETAKGALMDAVMAEALKAGALPEC